MIRQIAKQALLCLALSCSLSAVAGSAHEPLRWFRKAQPTMLGGKLEISRGVKKAAATAPSMMPESDDIEYMQGPGGKVWFATVKYDMEIIEHPAFTERLKKGITVTVYDENFQKVGAMRDTVSLAEGETKLSEAMVDMSVSKKFFNVDNKYEIIVSYVMNTKANISNIYSKVYSLDTDVTESTVTPTVTTIPGYVVDSGNYGPNEWSEDYFFSFIEEELGDDTLNDPIAYLETYGYRVITYRKAGYSGGPAVVNTVFVPMSHAPGDTTSAPFFMSVKNKNGMPAFIVSYYEKQYFENAIDFTNDKINPDNRLIIDYYAMPSLTASKAELVKKTAINCPQPEEGIYGKYMGIGQFAGSDDVDFVHFSQDGMPWYYVTLGIQATPMDEDLQSSVLLYDAEGALQRTVAADAGSYVHLSDIEGENPMTMFITMEDNRYMFRFVDRVTGEVKLETANSIGDKELSAKIDRVKIGGDVFYVSSLVKHYEINGVAYEEVGWMNADGEMERVDRLNLGKNIVLAQVYIGQNALNPFLFDTDNAMEYMLLLKRRSGYAINEELYLAKAGAEEPLMVVSPTDGKGSLVFIDLINLNGSNPAMSVVRAPSTWTISMENYTLPLTAFAGGTGTEADPYRIATMGDLQQIRKNPAAHYALVADLDGAATFSPVENFSGTLNGAMHTISNFQASQPIFGEGAYGAKVYDLRFMAPKMTLAAGSGNAGLLFSSASKVDVRNVHVYNPEIEGDDFDGKFGVIAGRITQSSKVAECYIGGADIELPKASVGGIAAELRDVAVNACAFTGAIKAGVEVGGIAGSTVNKTTIANCHVQGKISAANTVGGLVGNACRGNVNNCYVDVDIESTEASQHNGAMAGGLIGMLQPLFGSVDDNGSFVEPTYSPIVTNNVVALRAFAFNNASPNAPEYNAQQATAHRLVGRTVANEEPAITGYDEAWNPIFSDIQGVEGGLASNYVFGTVAPVDSALEASAASTEGAAVDALNVPFYEQLGFRFGDTASDPWSLLTSADSARLFFESSLIVPAEMRVAENENFLYNIILVNATPVEDIESLMSDFACEFNESMLEMTGEMFFENNTLSIGFRALAAGEATIKVNLQGSLAETRIVAMEAANGVVAPTVSTIHYDGTCVRAQGCTITVFDVAGKAMGTAANVFDMSSMAKGIYVVLATDKLGATSTLKVVR